MVTDRAPSKGGRVASSRSQVNACKTMRRMQPKNARKRMPAKCIQDYLEYIRAGCARPNTTQLTDNVFLDAFLPELPTFEYCAQINLDHPARKKPTENKCAAPPPDTAPIPQQHNQTPNNSTLANGFSNNSCLSRSCGETTVGLRFIRSKSRKRARETDPPNTTMPARSSDPYAPTGRSQTTCTATAMTKAVAHQNHVPCNQWT